MVAEAIRNTIAEAKKPKEVAPRSEESILAQRDAMVRGLPGYAHGNVLDMSKPLGKRNKVKKQGAANMGNWTSEARKPPSMDDGSDFIETDPLNHSIEEPNMYTGHRPGGTLAHSRLYKLMIQHGINPEKAQEIVTQFKVSDTKSEAVRQLVRMIVREEIRVRK